jgi:hypothetical protein
LKGKEKWKRRLWMATVDALLGDHRQRYFGDGHKRTLYNVVEIDDTLFGSITHSGTWSSKSQQEVQPHLSTLDGVILMVVAVLVTIFNRWKKAINDSG